MPSALEITSTPQCSITDPELDRLSCTDDLNFRNNFWQLIGCHLFVTSMLYHEIPTISVACDSCVRVRCISFGQALDAISPDEMKNEHVCFASATKIP